MSDIRIHTVAAGKVRRGRRMCPRRGEEPRPAGARPFTLVAIASRWGSSFVCHSAAGRGYVVFQAKSS